MQDPLIVGMIFAVAVAIIAAAVGVAFVVRGRVAQQLPEPVLRRGRTNALICAVAALAIFGLLTAVIRIAFGQPMIDTLFTAFGVYWISVFTWFFVGWFSARAAAGPVLRDCGPHPTRKLFWFNAAFFLLFFGGGNFAGLFDQITLPRIGGLLFGITFAIYSAVMATGRLQIREHGIWQFWSLLPWDRLQSFAWEGDSLMLQARTRFPGLGKGALPVPAEHKEAVTSLINQRVSIRSGTDDDSAAATKERDDIII